MPFNPASIPKAWVRRVLEDEHDYSRFEEFANAVVSTLEGKPVAGTSASWDLGRDGRGLGGAAGVFVLATLRSGVDKPIQDATSLKATSKPKRVYYMSARPHSEHTLKEHGAVVQEILGSTVSVEAIGGIQISDLVASGKADDAFRKAYAGEIAGIRAVLGGLDEAEAYHHQLELALSTFGATNTQELRVALGTRVILTLLEAGPATLESLAEGAARLIGVEVFSSSTLAYYRDILRDRDLISSQDGQYGITDLGRGELAKSRSEVVGGELKGRSAVRAAVEESLGSKLAEQHWSAIWVALQNELAKAFYLRGRQVLELVSVLSQGDTGGVERDVLEPLVETVLGRVVETHVTPPQRSTVLRALQDAFLPGDSHGAFEWLAGVTGRFAAICTLGLPQEIITSLREVLRTICFFFDTDIMISYLCDHEPANVAAHSVAGLSRGLGQQIMVTDAVAEEVARHAMKAHTDYRVRVASLGRPLEWYELAELESAFTREFEYLRLEGRLKPRDWTRFIERYTGPEERSRGRLLPNVAKMRQIMSKDSFAIRTPAGEGQAWVERRDALAGLLSERAKRFGGDDLDIVQEKARIDGEILIAVARTIEEAEARGTGERYILITSARRLRHLPGGVRLKLPYVPEVLSLPEAACIASLLPERPVSLKALHALLFEGHFEKTIGGLEAVLMQVVRQAGSAVIPGATRGVLLEEFSNAIFREVRQTGEAKSDVYARIRKDPVAFARIAAVALDALALPKPSDREEVLGMLAKALEDRGAPGGQDAEA